VKRRDLAALAAVFAAALLLRARGLTIIHDRGDQLIWAGLACHVAEDGFQGYTIRHIDQGLSPLGPDTALYRFRTTPEEVGSLLAGLKRSGEGYWDAPLANQPPVFTSLLVASHALLGERGDGFPLLGRGYAAGGTAEERLAREEGFARATAADPPPGAVRAQLWATLPVLLSELATVALVFLLARRLGGSTRAALVAASLYAFDPLAIFAAHRVLSNPTLATASAGAVLAFLAAEEDARWLPVAGLLAGAATLVKASALFLIPAGWRRPSFWLVALAITAPWGLLQWRLLGSPLGLAWDSQKDWLAASAWAQVVTSRGVFFYLLLLLRSPFLLVGLATTATWLRGGATPAARARSFAATFVLLVLLAAHVHTGGKEGRHILHVFPVLAVAASQWVDRLRGRAILLVAPVLVWQASHGLALAYATGAVPP
jgi:hypothetical protein